MASITYLTEIAGTTDEIFADAMGDPKIAPKKQPTLEAVLTAIVKVVERRSIAGAAELVRDDLEELYEMHVLMFGERPLEGDDTQADWDSSLDDKVEELFKPYADILSNDWMAVNTIDTRLDVEGAFDKAATSFGKEVHKQLCWQAGEAVTGGGKMKSPAQILASAGITTSAVLGKFADRISTAEGGNRTADAPAPEPTPSDTPELDAVMDAVFERVGIDYDVGATREELELALDDDEVLAMGAAQRIGITDEQGVNALQMFSLNEGAQALDKLMSMLADRSLAAKDPKPKPARATPAKRASELDNPGLDPLVLSSLQTHSGISAATMAERLGVSRATYNNYVNGKTVFHPDDVQRQTIREQIEADLNGLQNALDLL